MAPAVSKKQQMVMAIAKHQPEKLYKKNKGILKMGKEQMHEYAETKRKGLPEHKPMMEAMKKKLKK